MSNKFLDPCSCAFYILNNMRFICPPDTVFVTGSCKPQSIYPCTNPWSRIGVIRPFNLTLCRMKWPANAFRTWNKNYLNHTSQVNRTVSRTLQLTTVSALDNQFECTTESPQQNCVSPALIALLCITVLLLAVIIIFIYRRMSGKEIIPTWCICSQKCSKPQTDSDRDYVEPNNVIQGKIPGAVRRPYLIGENMVCENCHRTISEKRSPETENEAHDYIYLQDNTYHNDLPDANMKTNSPEPIPEVIYNDSRAPDIVPNARNKADPIYHIIDPVTVSDPQTQSDERASDLGSSSSNEYHVIELSNVASNN